jgi:hypothetical protein
MSLTQAVDTYSPPDGRMLKREAPSIGEYVLLSDYEALRDSLAGLRTEMDALRAELNTPVVGKPVAKSK